ncbi:unnamed protein product [Urochloa decumbens]|uniref:Uncharacterized protein n=1 Tax=Urochloa decumbens TaxID=240449 RepID=A0ABC9FIJ3_9POAL
MAVTASALGAHVIRSLDDLLRGPLSNAGAALRVDAEKLRQKLKQELLYSEDAENLVLEEDGARQWLAELLQVLYKVDHQLLEAYGADAQTERPSLFVPIMRHFSTDRYIKKYIRSLLQNIGSVSENRPSILRRKNKENYRHDRSCNGQELMCPDSLVGTEIELKMLSLVDKLTEHHEPSQHFLIFAIYGLGGVGKTTFARKIFDDQRTKSAFSTRVWVYISKGSSLSQILLTTCAAIEGLKGPKTSNKVQKKLADIIGGRKIFLVFDIYNGFPSKKGVGNSEIYRNLIEVIMSFHAAAEGSRVLIITTDENVGSELKSAQIQKGAEGYGLQTHRLSQLTVEDSWMLLVRVACLEEAKVTPELKKIGIGILQKCNGLPLAIRAVGGILRQKGYRPKQWQCIHNSRAFSLKDPTTGTEGGVRSSVYLSYQHALPHLKPCFLYLSLFPVDFEIEQQLITQLWISEGLIDTRHGHSSEETSDGGRQVESSRHDNREEITQEQGRQNTLSRDTHTPDASSASSDNIVDEGIKSSEQANREHSSFPSHEIVEDDQHPPEVTSGHSSNERLCKQNHCSVQEVSTREQVHEIADRYFEELVDRGLLQQENKTKGYKMHEQVRKIAEFLTENEACAGDDPCMDVARLSTSLHRLSFLNKGLNTIPEDVGRFKSLRTLLLSGNSLGEKDLDVICKNLVFLRVLDLSNTEINSIPKTLRNLERLRHLNLSRTRIRTLPESIDRLRRLRFLGLERCEYLTSLPKSIQKLSKLEYLNLRDSEIKGPPRLHNLRHLTFLQGFVVDSISSNGWPLQELQNMINLTRLQIKIIRTQDRTTANDEVLKKKDNLRNLELSYCTVNSETLSDEEAARVQKMFAQLHPHQCLESLEIDGYYGNPYPGWLSFSELPNLQQLNLVNCRFCEKLPPVWQLQKLKFLRIANLAKLEKIDMEPRTEMTSFPNLEELQVEDMKDLDYWSGFQAGDLPNLRKFSLRRCPKLKHLPAGLEHCKVIPMMELRDAGLVDVLENIPVQELLVEAMPSLTTVSNLPLMKVFTVVNCPMLGIVSGVNSVQHIHMEDEKLDQLPKWLEQHVSRIETLDIVGEPQLIRRCERNNEDWYIIREIARVYAYLSGRRAFFSYTRSNDFFCRYNQTRQEKSHEDPNPAAPAGVHGRGASVPSGSGNSTVGTKSAPGPARARHTLRRSTSRWLPVAFFGCTLFTMTMLINHTMLTHHMGTSLSVWWLAISFFLHMVALLGSLWLMLDHSNDLN